MAFSFEHFSRGLSETADKIGAGIMKRWETNELNRIWKERQAMIRAGNREDTLFLAKKNQKMAREDELWKQSRIRMGDLFGGDELIGQQYYKDITSMNPTNQLRGMAVASLWKKVGSNKIFDKQDFKVLSGFDLRNQAKLGKANAQNVKYYEQFKLEKAKVADIAATRRLERERKEQLIDEKNRILFNKGLRRRSEQLKSVRGALDTAQEAMIESGKDLQKEISKREITATQVEKIFRKKKGNKELPFSMYDSKGRLTPAAKGILLNESPGLQPFFSDFDSKYKVFESKDKEYSSLTERIGRTLGEPTKLWKAEEEFITIEDVQPEDIPEKKVKATEIAGTIEEYRIPKGTQTWTTPDGIEVVKRGGKLYRIIK